MGFLRQLFGPSQEEVWQQLSGEIGADFIPGGFLDTDKVVARVQEWTVTLDVFSVGRLGHFTRMRAPYVNPDGFRFTICRGLLRESGEKWWLPDIEVGYPEFDTHFVTQGNDETKVRALLANPRIRELIQAQESLFLQVKDDEGWFGAHFPEGVDELYFQVPGVLKDLERLRSLYDLFAEILNHLCHLGSAYEDDPNIVL